MSEGPHRLLVVDDSPAMQKLITLLLQPEIDLKIVAIAGSAEEGWGQFCREIPQLVLLDLELPNRPGIDLLRRIMAERPVPVVIVSANGGVESANTVDALAAGAIAFIEKPNAVETGVEEFRVELLRTIRTALSAQQSVVRMAPKLAAPAPAPVAPAPGQPLVKFHPDRIVAIGASTGGVAAIQKVLTSLGPACPPIVITQHMPSGYTQRFSERLMKTTGYDVREASDGLEIKNGRVIIAPGDKHLHVIRTGGDLVCKLDDGPLVSGHKPSVDVLFRSVAKAAGRGGVGVILTGMGRDGAEGLLEMRKAGALTVAESEKTAIVFGMPKAALEIRGTDQDLALDAIGTWILRAAVSDPNAERKPAAAPTAERDKRDLRTMPIEQFRSLVVDDQKSMRGLASMSLKQLGFVHVDEAESGEEALKRVRSANYDLILADWNMEGMSGLDLVREIRKEKSARDLAIIMTTSESHVSKVSEAMDAGANNYLIKPCEKQKLQQRLERALMRRLAAA